MISGNAAFALSTLLQYHLPPAGFILFQGIVASQVASLRVKEDSTETPKKVRQDSCPGILHYHIVSIDFL
jgi:hypothetical protein